jgi:alkaline phosphatase D
LPPDALKRAGLKISTWVDKKTPALMQAAIEQSATLRPFIAGKVGKVIVGKNFHHYGSDEEFNYQYLKLTKTVVPFGSQQEKALLNIRSFYHPPTDSIHLRRDANLGQALPLAISKYAFPGFRSFFGESVERGLADYFANLVLQEQGLDRIESEFERPVLICASDLVGVAGLSMVAKAYFQNHQDLLNYLRGKLSIGPVRTEELAGDALCKTALLQTARFASQPLRNMVAVGMTRPRSVRLWLRTDVSGPHMVEITGGSSGARTMDVVVPAGQPGDKTLGFEYPGTSGLPPLDPFTRYRYRIVRKSDGTPLGEGSFQTSPAGDADTPSKVVIAVMSCHQPFTDRGTIAPESERMLRLIPRILQENDVKFVLPCGDQIYADDPGVFSLFGNRFLLRQLVPNATDILKCSAEEVRRLYDMRYRIFFAMNPIRKMYANYPCYPTLDDHEIRGDWGSVPKHSTLEYHNLKRGALQAYYDYQASSVLPAMPKAPWSFHYQFSYGNIGVFVMDIRSDRFVNSRNQMFSIAQFVDFQNFLRENRQKKVLLIVASVPVVHLAPWLAEVGHKVINRALSLFDKDIDFPDHWSFYKNLSSRDKFLTLLHAHQQANPGQRVVIVSGDVHIGNVFGIHWQGGNKPRLYQFTSSPISALFRGFEADVTTLGPRLVSSLDVPDTPYGPRCSARVGLLPGVSPEASRNPLIGLNLGLIEVRRDGDQSNLKFKLIGYHPKEDRPVTYFESGFLI